MSEVIAFTDEEIGELIEFLRKEGLDPCDDAADLIESQAAELSALRERVKELEVALNNFMRWREASLRSEVLPDLPEVEMVRQARELLSTRREEG